MSAWILTLGLQNLRRQVDAAFPDRDRTSDGTIGDAAHEAEMSGHNPDDTAGSKAEWNGDPDSTPEVRAWDMDNNLAPGLDCQVLVDHIRALPGVSSVIRYMIYNRRMYHERDGFAPSAYTGPSAHTEHVHFSGAWSQAADNNTTFDFRLEEISVPLTDPDKEWLKTEIAKAVWAYQLQRPGEPAGMTTSAGAYQAYNDVVNKQTADAAADRVIAAVAAADKPDPAALAQAIAAAIPAELAAQVADVLAQRLAS